MNKDLTLDQKFKKAETIDPAWERVTVFSWGDLLGMKKRIAELEHERNLAEGRIDELEQENERLRDALNDIEAMDRHSMYQRCPDCWTKECRHNDKTCKDVPYSPIGKIAAQAIRAEIDNGNTNGSIT